MHHFLFLPYTAEGRWKGCGYHALHCWAVLLRAGYITNENSDENLGVPLSKELTYTYIRGGKSTYEPVGRGMWLSYDPVEDEHTPESIFSDARLTYQLP